MKPPFAYYGGKTRLAPWIASLLPAHRVYVEPFAGSAAVLFAKTPSTHEIINDLSGDVVNFFKLLRERPEDLERACRLSPYSREEYETCDAHVDELDAIERARRWWVLSSQSFGSMAKVGTSWAFSINRGSNNARSVRNQLDRFAAAAARLATVTIERRDALEVIQRCDAPDGVIYADPPYIGTARSSFAGGRRPGGDYFHEFHTDEQHQALAETLRSVDAAVLLSGYPSALYDDLYSDWHRAERNVARRSALARGSSLPHATEVVWSNRPLVDRQQLKMPTTIDVHTDAL